MSQKERQLTTFTQKTVAQKDFFKAITRIKCYKRVSEGVQSSNILSFCVIKTHLSPGKFKNLFFHPDIVQPNTK